MMGPLTSRLLVVTFVILCGATGTEQRSRNYNRDKGTGPDPGSSSSRLIVHTESPPAAQHASSESVTTRAASSLPVSSSNPTFHLSTPTSQISIQDSSVTPTLVSSINDNFSTHVPHGFPSSHTLHSSGPLAIPSIHSHPLFDGSGRPQKSESESPNTSHAATSVSSFIPAQATNSHNRGFLNQHTQFRGSPAHSKFFSQANSTVVKSGSNSKSTATGQAGLFTGNNHHHHNDSQSLAHSPSSTSSSSDNEAPQSTQHGLNHTHSHNAQPIQHIPGPPIVPILGSTISSILGDPAGKTNSAEPSSTDHEGPQPTKHDPGPTVVINPLLPITSLLPIVGSLASSVVALPHSILSSVASDLLGHGHGHGHPHTSLPPFNSPSSASSVPTHITGGHDHDRHKASRTSTTTSESRHTTTSVVTLPCLSILGPIVHVSAAIPGLPLPGLCSTSTARITTTTSSVRSVSSPTSHSRHKTTPPESIQTLTGPQTSPVPITLSTHHHSKLPLTTLSLTHPEPNRLPSPSLVSSTQNVTSYTPAPRPPTNSDKTPPESTVKHSSDGSTAPTKSSHNTNTGSPTGTAHSNINAFLFGDQLVHPQSVGGVVIGMGAVVYILAMSIIYIFMRRRYEQENGIQTPLTPAPSRRWNQRVRRYGRL